MATRRQPEKKPPRRSTRLTRNRKAAPAEIIVHEDLNLAVASLLYDMAALQPTERSQFGYKRAARAIVGLPVSVRDLVQAGTVREIPFVGPASARIITEVVEQGRSPAVEAAIGQSARRSDVISRRRFRSGYLSHFALHRALATPLGKRIVGRADYRGDFQMHSTWE